MGHHGKLRPHASACRSTPTKRTWVERGRQPRRIAVVFDVLGDLLRDADRRNGRDRRRASPVAPAFDMQPRFSPDGKWIAFTSDRDGLWNIWVMKPDGTGCAPGDARRSAGSSTAPRGRQTASTSTRAATSSRNARTALVRSGCTTLSGRRRTPGHREEWLAEGRWGARGVAGWPLPLLQQRRHTRTDLPVRQGPLRDHLRHHPARSREWTRTHRSRAARRIDHAARLAGRAFARLHPPGALEDRPLRTRSRLRCGAAGVGWSRSRHAGSLGDAGRLPAVRVDARRPGARHLGAGPHLARGCHERPAHADSVPRARGADAD